MFQTQDIQTNLNFQMSNILSHLDQLDKWHQNVEIGSLVDSGVPTHKKNKQIHIEEIIRNVCFVTIWGHFETIFDYLSQFLGPRNTLN